MVRRGDNMSTYLSGPMANATDKQRSEWRNYCKQHLKGTVYNPMERHHLGAIMDNLGIVQQIVECDKQEIDASKVLIVMYIPGMPMVGTSMEIMYAYDRQKFIIVVTNGHSISPWITYHARKLINTLDDAIKEANFVNEWMGTT